PPISVANAPGTRTRHSGHQKRHRSNDRTDEPNSTSGAVMKHILVTGAGGYIGSVLVDDLLSAGYRVTAIDRFFFGEDVHQRHRANPSYSQTKIDIRDLRPDDFESVDAVCDLAALSNDPSADIDPQLTNSINFSGRLHVATCAKK